MKALLDTHVLLWWLNDPSRLSAGQKRVVEGVTDDAPLLVADISLWEVATLYDVGRIRLRLPLRDWLEKAVAPPRVRRIGVTPAIAAELAALPGALHRDPADRILVATARVYGATLLTHDKSLLASGLVDTLG